jgi:aminopeptidase N
MIFIKYLIRYIFYFALTPLTHSLVNAQNEILSYDLEFEIFPEQKFIKGTNKITFLSEQPSGILHLALFENMKVTSVKVNNKNAVYNRSGDSLLISFKTKSKDNLTCLIAFEGKPKQAIFPPWSGGFIWGKDSLNRNWVNVACQNEGAQLWWPVDPDLSKEPKRASMTFIAPDAYQTISNGRKIKEETLPNGRTLSKWQVNNPINTYNISLYLGHYTLIQDTLQRPNGILDLQYYVLDYDKDRARNWFASEVKPMLRCFEQALGTYPFEDDGFKLVQSSYAGMEHQSAIAYGNGFSHGYKGEDYSGIGLEFDFILVHETGHEWWGNSVSKKTKEDFWIHEAFCTYAEKVYVNCRFGEAAAEAYMRHKRTMVKNKFPIAGNKMPLLETSDLYTKGSLFISNLEHIVGKKTSWKNFLKDLTITNKHRNIETKDVIDAFSKAADFDLQFVFNQYLYHTQLPVLEYYIEEYGKEGFLIHHRWNAEVQDFNMPVLANTEGADTWFYPTSEWQISYFAIGDADDFSWRDDLFYAHFVKINPQDKN